MQKASHLIYSTTGFLHWLSLKISCTEISLGIGENFLFRNIERMLLEPCGLEYGMDAFIWRNTNMMLLEPCGLEYQKDAFVWRNTYLSVPLLTQCPPHLQQEERQAIFNLLQTKMSTLKDHSAQSYLDGGGAWHENSVIPYAAPPTTQQPAAPLHESQNLLPLHAVTSVVRRLGIGDQQSA
jgi:hypothetical protein